MRVLMISLLLCACGATEETPRPLRIAAASSLSDVVPELARTLSLGPIEARYDASSTLARQIQAGDEIDLFLSADARWADHVTAAGLTVGEATPFASNGLVVVVPVEGGRAIGSLAELAQLEHVAVAGPEVPAGRLAREALAHDGVLEVTSPHLVDAPNVRGALAWVTRGEAEAAIVFATDARVEPAVRVAFVVPPTAHTPAVDVGVVLRGAHEAEARAFLDALGTPGARAVLVGAGFGPPP